MILACGKGRICAPESFGPGNQIAGQRILPRIAVRGSERIGKLESKQDVCHRFGIHFLHYRLAMPQVRNQFERLVQNFRRQIEHRREQRRHGKILVIGNFGRNQAGHVESLAFGLHVALVIRPGARAAPIFFGNEECAHSHQCRQYKKKLARGAPAKQVAKEPPAGGCRGGGCFHKSSGQPTSCLRAISLRGFGGTGNMTGASPASA